MFKKGCGTALFIFLRQSSHQSCFDSLCFVRSFPTEEIFFVMLGFVEFVSAFFFVQKMCLCFFPDLFLSFIQFNLYLLFSSYDPSPALSKTQRRQT